MPSRSRSAAGQPAAPRSVRFCHCRRILCGREHWPALHRRFSAASGGTAVFRSRADAAARLSPGLPPSSKATALRARDRGEIRDRSRRAPDDDHRARPQRRQGRAHPHRFGNQAHHSAALYEPGLGGGRAAGCGCCAAPTISTITPPRSRRSPARWSPSGAATRSFHGHRPHIGERRVAAAELGDRAGGGAPRAEPPSLVGAAEGAQPVRLSRRLGHRKRLASRVPAR